MKIQESAAAANCCHCQWPQGCESRPDDLGWVASVCILKSLVMFNALLYDLLNCIAFVRCRRHRMSTYACTQRWNGWVKLPGPIENQFWSFRVLWKQRSFTFTADLCLLKLLRSCRMLLDTEPKYGSCNEFAMCRLYRFHWPWFSLYWSLILRCWLAKPVVCKLTFAWVTKAPDPSKLSTIASLQVNSLHNIKQHLTSFPIL